MGAGDASGSDNPEAQPVGHQPRIFSSPTVTVYVGTYTRSGRSDGLQLFEQDPATGKLSHRSSVAEVDPSFLARDPGGRFLFAVSEGRGLDGGAVVSYAIDPASGEL